MQKYDPKKFSLDWGAPGFGLSISSGIAAGSFIFVSRDERTWQHRKGTDGERTRNRTNNLSGSITVVLRRTSLVNTALSTVAAADELTGIAVGPLFLAPTDGGLSLFTSPTAYLDGWPDDVFSTSEGTRSWTWICDPLIMFEGQGAST